MIQTETLTTTPLILDVREEITTITSLTQSLLASDLMNEEDKRQIEKWRDQVSHLEQPGDLAIALSYLLLNAIAPKIGIHTSEKDLEKLLDFEEKITKLILEQCPEINIESFLQQQSALTPLAAINDLAHLQIDAITTAAEEADRKLLESYKVLKAKLRENEEQQQRTEKECSQKIQALQQQILSAKSHLEKSAQQAEAVGEHLNLQVEQLKQIKKHALQKVGN